MRENTDIPVVKYIKTNNKKDYFTHNGRVAILQEFVNGYEYEKNEFVILKIIENDLKQNCGLDVKEFVLDEQKLNMYKSLRDNKIKDNSVIKVIL